MKGRSGGKEKHAAVVASLPAAVELLEFGAGKDLLNDDTIMALRDEYIKAQALVLNARRQAQEIIAQAEGIAETAKKALEVGILAKSSS